MNKVSPTLSRGYGTLAGMGFIGAAVLAVPSTLLLDPRPPAEDYLITVAGLFTGLVVLALPWERMDPRWLHAVGVLATIQAAGAVAVFGQVYTAFFFLIAVTVAYMVSDTRGLLLHFAVIGLALFGPIAYGPASPEGTLQVGLVVYPLLALTAGIFAYLRQRMVADKRSYQLFAEETISLAQRISGSPLPAVERRPPEVLNLPSWSRFRVSARIAGFAAGLLAVPLLTAGLAGAGVKLPSVANDALDRVGIDLPNQEGAQGGAPAAPEVSGPAPDGQVQEGDHRESTPPAQPAGDAREPAGNETSAVPPSEGVTESQSGTGSPTGTPPVVVGSGQGAPPVGEEGETGPAEGSDPSSIAEALQNTLDLLGANKSPGEEPDE